jgi:hypothetical protein
VRVIHWSWNNWLLDSFFHLVSSRSQHWRNGGMHFRSTRQVPT